MTTKFKVQRKPETNEWVVVVTVDGKRVEERCYYTDDKQDANDTRDAMQIEQESIDFRKQFSPRQ